MLYDPYGSSENGIIVIDSENDVDDNVTVASWGENGYGMTIEQEGDMICLTSTQVEILYQIIKHNR